MDRTQLANQRNLAHRGWSLLLLFVPGTAMAMAGRTIGDGRSASQLVVLVLIGVLIFLGVVWWIRRSARKYQDQIDELNRRTE